MGVAASALLAAMVCVPKPAQAWDFREHKAICASAYRTVCSEVRGTVRDGSPAWQRWRAVCEAVDVHADVYGQACALAGDRVGTPEELATAAGAVHAVNDISYSLLALENHEHFQPHSTRSWREHHRQAVKLAKKAAKRGFLERTQAWEKALMESAFADHFLADSFAAGHMGFNRAASDAGASKVHHDVWNQNGRWVHSLRKAADGRYEEWFVLGDSNLDHQQNKANLDRILRSETLSLKNVVQAFVFGGEAKDDLGAALVDGAAEIWTDYPAAVLMVHKYQHWRWFAVLDYQQADGHDTPTPKTDANESAQSSTASTFLALALIHNQPIQGKSDSAIAVKLSLGRLALARPADRGPSLDVYLGYGANLREFWDGPGSVRGLYSALGLAYPLFVFDDGKMSLDAMAGAQNLASFEHVRVTPYVGLRYGAYVSKRLLQVGLSALRQVYDSDAAIKKDWGLMATVAYDLPELKRKPYSVVFEPLAEVRMPAKYGWALSLNPVTQVGLKGPSEFDLLGQLSLGPYHSEMFLVHGFYLDLKLGWGWQGQLEEDSLPDGRNGMVGAVDLDFPLGRSVRGLMSTNLVVGVQTLGWVGRGPNGGPFLALRENFYPANWLVQVTAGVIDRVIDFDVADRVRWDRLAVMLSISVGPILGNYPLRCLGVPSPALME